MTGYMIAKIVWIRNSLRTRTYYFRETTTGSTLHSCRIPKARMFALFTKDIGVTTLIIRSHSDDAAYFTFIELTSSVPLAELLVETFRQSVEHGPLFKGIWKTTLEGQPPSSVQHAILSLCSGTVLTHWSTLNNPTFACSNRCAKSCYCRALLLFYTKEIY